MVHATLGIRLAATRDSRARIPMIAGTIRLERLRANGCGEVNRTAVDLIRAFTRETDAGPRVDCRVLGWIAGSLDGLPGPWMDCRALGWIAGLLGPARVPDRARCPNGHRGIRQWPGNHRMIKRMGPQHWFECGLREVGS